MFEVYFAPDSSSIKTSCSELSPNFFALCSANVRVIPSKAYYARKYDTNEITTINIVEVPIDAYAIACGKFNIPVPTE